MVCEDWRRYAAAMELAVDLEPLSSYGAQAGPAHLRRNSNLVASVTIALGLHHPLATRDFPPITPPSKPGNGIALCASTFD